MNIVERQEVAEGPFENAWRGCEGGERMNAALRVLSIIITIGLVWALMIVRKSRRMM